MVVQAVEGQMPLRQTFPANADLSAKQFYFVALLSTGKVDVADNGTAGAIGILQNKPTAGQAADVVILGRTKAVFGASINPGLYIGPGATGKVTAYTPAAGSGGPFVLGVCEIDGGADTQIGTVIINCLNPVLTT